MTAAAAEAAVAVDGLAGGFSSLFVVVAVVALVAGGLTPPGGGRVVRRTEAASVVASTAAACGLVATRDLLVAYGCLEVLGLATVTLALDAATSRAGRHRARSMAVANLVASGALLFGVVSVAGLGGALGYGDLARSLGHLTQTESQVPEALVVAAVMAGAGAAAKVGLGPAPFAAFRSTRTSEATAAFFVVVPPLAALASLVRFGHDVLHFGGADPALARAPWSALLGTVAMAMAVLGPAAALAGGPPRRTLALASLGALGSLAILVSAATPVATAAFVFHALVYAVSTVGAYAVLGLLKDEGPHGAAGAGARRLVAGAMLVVIAGGPPFGGLVSRIYGIRSLFGPTTSTEWNATLVGALVAAALIGAAAYVRILGPLLLGASRAAAPGAPPSRREPLYGAALAALAVMLWLGLKWGDVAARCTRLALP